MRFVFPLLLALWVLPISSCGDAKEARPGKSLEKAPPLERAEKLLTIGRYQDAFDILSRIKKKKVDDKRFWNLYGLAARYNAYLEGDAELRNVELKAFRRALTIDDTFSAARMNLATTLWELGKKEEAVTLYRKLLAQSPERKDAAQIQARVTSHAEALAKKNAPKKLPPPMPPPAAGKESMGAAPQGMAHPAMSAQPAMGSTVMPAPMGGTPPRIPSMKKPVAPAMKLPHNRSPEKVRPAAMGMAAQP